MSTIEQAVEIDGDKLMQFVFRAVDEVGATLNAALVVMGDKLGLYRALAGAGPLAPAELAERTGTAERYVREWLNAQAAGGYVELRPRQRPLHAAAGAGGRAHRPGQPRVPARVLPDRPRARCSTRPRSSRRPRSGAGFGWHEHVHDVHEGCERFFRPGYNANLISGWLPALDGVVAKLERGALVADVGCGHGASTILMAQAFPNSTLRRLGLPRRLDRDGAPPGAGGRASPTGSASRSPRRRPTAAPATTW